VQVDEPGADDEAVGIDPVADQGARLGDGVHPSGGDPDVRHAPRSAGPVDDRPTADHQLAHRSAL
jgi:hypothetical protein